MKPTGTSFALNKWVKLRVNKGRTLQLYSVWHQEFHAVICATFYSPWPRWQSRWLIMITMFSFYLALTSQRRDKLLFARVSRWDWSSDHQGFQRKLRFNSLFFFFFSWLTLLKILDSDIKVLFAVLKQGVHYFFLPLRINKPSYKYLFLFISQF